MCAHLYLSLYVHTHIHMFQCAEGFFSVQGLRIDGLGPRWAQTSCVNIRATLGKRKVDCLLDCWEQQLRKMLLRVAGCREQFFFRVEVAQGLVKHMDAVT